MKPRNDSPWPDAPLCIVDDDEHWIAILTAALESMGWRNIRALSDPTYAMQLASEFKAAAVLLDLRMAQKDGSQVLREIKAKMPDLPVIVVTGVDETEAAVDCMREGAADFLTKPLDRGRLEAALKTAVVPEDTNPEDGLQFEECLHEVRDLPNLKEVPDMLIAEAMRRSNGVVKDAANMLGISAQAICNRRRRSRDAEEAIP